MIALVFGKAFGAIASVILIRYLGAELQGTYSYLLTIVALFSFISDFGLQSLLIREVKSAGENGGKVLGNAVVLQVTQVIISIAIVNLYGVFFETDPEIRKSLMLASVAFSLLYVVNPFLASMGSYEKMNLTGLSNSIASILNAVIIFISVNLKLPLNGIIIMLALSNMLNLAVTAFLCVKFTVKPVFKIEKSTLINLFRMSIPFAVIGLFNFVYSRIDVPLLYKMRPAEEVGYYTAVTKLIEILNSLVMMIMGPVYPRIAFIVSTEGKEKVRRVITLTVKYMMVLVAPFAMMVTITSADYVRLILGAGFEKSAVSLSIMIWIIFLMSIHVIPTFALNASRLTKLVTYVYGVNIVINLMFNILLIPKYGYVATSCISVLCGLFVAVMAVYFVKVKIGEFKVLRNLARIFGALCAEAAVMMFLKDKIPFIPLNIIGLLVFYAVIFLIRYFNREDFEIFKNIIIRRKADNAG